MKKEHTILIQLEQALNNFSAVISEEEDRLSDAKACFSQFDEILVKLIEHRILAKHTYADLEPSVDWDKVRKSLS